MPKLTPPNDLVEFAPWQYLIARVVPMLYITTLTLAIPTILTRSFVVSELGLTQEQKLRHQLRSISIGILAHGETIGSGVLLAKQQQVYTVITNVQVIQAASLPFQIQTPDGQIYAAALITPPVGQNRDLSVLRFHSLRSYLTAKLATTLPKTGDRVWSSGFPLDRLSDTDRPVSALNIVSSQIVQILPIAISGGYSIGSDRPIERGMSGGPLLNRSGKLIGINGVRANFRQHQSEMLEDGSKVGDLLHQQIKNSNWAIPSHFIKEFARLP